MNDRFHDNIIEQCKKGNRKGSDRIVQNLLPRNVQCKSQDP
jgi:hypothetical protein